MLYLPPHTKHVLQTSTELCSSPSRHTLINRQQNSGKIILMLQSGNLVSENVSSQLRGKKGRNSWECHQSFWVHCYYLLTLTLSPKIHFGPLHTYTRFSRLPVSRNLWDSIRKSAIFWTVSSPVDFSLRWNRNTHGQPNTSQNTENQCFKY
jgi:hypothetical protein